MRKGILIFCVVALLCVATTAAMASEDYWVVKFRVGNTASTVYNSAMTAIDVAQIGAQTTAPADSPDAGLVSSSANYITMDTGVVCATSWQTSLNYPVPYTYNMILAVGTDFGAPTQVFISAWSPDKISGTANRSLPANYRVVVSGKTEGGQRPVGVLATWTAADLKVLATTADPEPTGVGKKGFWYTYTSQYTTFGSSADLFTVKIELIPEPGSILALGSGLVGMVGFAIRRRRK